MSVNIVDLLKTIQVYAQNCETFRLGRRQFQLCCQTLIEARAIWKIRQRIPVCHESDTLLCLPPLRHIIKHGEKIFWCSVYALNGDLHRGDEPNSLFVRRNIVVENEDGLLGEYSVLILNENTICAFFFVYLVRSFPDNMITTNSEQFFACSVQQRKTIFLDG